MIVAPCPTCYRMVREDHFDEHVRACPVRSGWPAWLLLAGLATTVVACWLGA